MEQNNSKKISNYIVAPFVDLELKRSEYHNPYLFDFVYELEKNWKTIKSEFDNLENELFHPWPEKNLYTKDGKVGEGWDVFGLYAFGKKHYRNAELCPETLKMVEKIPGMTTAAFSVLNPKSHILPHVGYYGYSEMVLRCHLGVSVPENCWLNVNEKLQTWKNGKCLIFDDTYIHSAHNEGDERRVILLLDFNSGVPIKTGQEKTPIIDQRGYLDNITTQYGYGVKLV